MIQRYIAGQTQVHGNGDCVANAARTQVMDAAYVRFASGDFCYFFFEIVWQAAFRQFANSLIQKFKCRNYNYNAYHHGSDGVEHCPFRAQKERAAHADGGTDRR